MRDGAARYPSAEHDQHLVSRLSTMCRSVPALITDTHPGIATTLPLFRNGIRSIRTAQGQSAPLFFIAPVGDNSPRESCKAGRIARFAVGDASIAPARWTACQVPESEATIPRPGGPDVAGAASQGQRTLSLCVSSEWHRARPCSMSLPGSAMITLGATRLTERKAAACFYQNHSVPRPAP